MNRMTVLLPLTLAVALLGPALQAQTPSTPGAPGSASAETNELNNSNTPLPDVQATDSADDTNAIRIVRLSQASGKVELDRNAGSGFETAFNNLPITEAARLRTGAGSAEVEFEDGTTLRLVPDTEVDFAQLRRFGDGTTSSSMSVVQGTVYVSLNTTRGNLFKLTSGDGVITPRPGTHLRLEVKDPESRLSVISGTADFTNTSGSRDVGKMKSLIFNTTTHASADLIAGVEDSQYDWWDEQQAEYQKRYSRGNALAGSGYAYGLADLNYYGAFSDVDGCGRIWRPYFTSAAWDPYASGIWAWYPGSGYSWVSPYPWGWAPFHYGSWLQCGGGWGWQPGGRWYGLSIPGLRRIHHEPGRLHPFPPRPRPIPGKERSLVLVNQKPLIFSRVDRASSSFHFRNDSAGLGVPRGEFDSLHKLSKIADKTGSSNAAVFFTPINHNDSVSHSGFAERNTRTSATRPGDHSGFFNRPGTQNAAAHTTYAERSSGYNGIANRSSYSNNQRSAGYSSGGNGYSSGFRTGGGSPSGTSNGYAGGSHAGGGYSGGGGVSVHSSPPAPSAAPASSAGAHR